MIEELALQTLFTPVGVAVFIGVSAIAILTLWGPDLKRWRRRRNQEYQEAVAEARKVLDEGEALDRELEVDDAMLRLLKRLQYRRRR